MNIHSIIAAVLLTLASAPLSGCASDGSASPGPGSGTRELTCAVIAGPNCWTDAIAAVQGCAPGASVTGSLSADARACTFPDGAHATFTGDDVTQLGLQPSFGFELDAAGGTLCAAFSTEPRPSDVRTLRTARGEASWTIDDQVTLSCPDGSVYRTDLRTATACPGFDTAVGFATASGGGDFQFSLMSRPAPVQVLSCARDGAP